MKVLVFNCRKVLEINCRKMMVFTCFLHMHDTYTLAVENKLFPETKSNTPEQMLPPAPDFAELPIPQMDPALHGACSDSSIRISCNDFLVMVDPDFSERELMKVLRVMKHV